MGKGYNMSVRPQKLRCLTEQELCAHNYFEVREGNQTNSSGGNFLFACICVCCERCEESKYAYDLKVQYYILAETQLKTTGNY